MGFGRAGWYSYDQIDMRGGSADAIYPDWQGVSVDDILPTDPNGGFRVAVLEPDRAMVLYGDMELWRAQATAAAARRAEKKETAGKPANLKAVGAVSGATSRARRIVGLLPAADRRATDPSHRTVPGDDGGSAGQPCRRAGHGVRDLPDDPQADARPQGAR
jgi:hypothetical protein